MRKLCSANSRMSLWLLACLSVVPCSGIAGGQNYFAGALGGFSILSADHRATVTPSSSTITAYGASNGPDFMVYFGRHFSDYLSFQGTYSWNRNDLTMSSVAFGSAQSSYEELRTSSQQSFIGDLMLYFRNRRSFARPYLSVGTGIVHLTSSLREVQTVVGSPVLPAQKFTSNAPALRVAVGIDLFVRKGWAFRYSFAETIRSNAISQQLSPPGMRDLANFQNLFGLTRQF